MASGKDGMVSVDGDWQNAAATLVCDWATRLSVSFWFCLLAALAAREITALAGEPGAFGALRLLAKISLFLFLVTVASVALLRSRPVAKGTGLRPRIDALAGTYLLFGFSLFPTLDLGVSLHLLSAVLLFTGNIVSVVILVNLGRCFSIMAEARGLVTTGPYAFVRHPLYLAEQVAAFGAFLQFAAWQTAVLFALQFLFQVRRMMNEEAVLLRTFPDYAGYMKQTARFIPGIW
jgi:protein-S-isoprenylcysteine O-methyltransferase Ste14